MEIKHIALEEIKADDESRTIEGFASVFDNIDSYKDIVLPGAFTKTLKKKAKLPMLWQHDSGDVIGVWTEFEERDKGLWVKGQLLDTTLGMDAYKIAKAGAVTGMSIGYSTKKYEIDHDKGVRKLIEIDLYEVSLVTFPANDRAQVTSVKKEDGSHMTAREFEDFLRDVGKLSQKDAKKIVSEGYKAFMTQRDVEEHGHQEISKLFNQFTL